MKVPISQCQPETGVVIPVIDRSRCDGKQDCVAVCPFDVFEMQRLTAEDTFWLPVSAKKRQKLVGRWQAFTPNADRCHACNLCVVACPEDAIRLVRQTQPDAEDAASAEP
ncbi:ATP-binding protein [Silvibacterium sp.]|uniref:ATP-binding protein n=1 Tax=Silvibacterium sp. TaxID=1964179 RepID=UPI0039E33446